MTHHYIAKKGFNKKTLKSLKEKNIIITGSFAYSVTYENGSTGYETAYRIDDNGISKVKDYLEVTGLVGE